MSKVRIAAFNSGSLRNSDSAKKDRSADGERLFFAPNEMRMLPIELFLVQTMSNLKNLIKCPFVEKGTRPKIGDASFPVKGFKSALYACGVRVLDGSMEGGARTEYRGREALERIWLALTDLHERQTGVDEHIVEDLF